MDGGEIIETADHLIGDAADEPGRLHPAGAVLQPLLGDHPPAEEGALEDLDGPAPLLRLITDGVQRRGGELSPQAIAVNDVSERGGAKARRHGGRYRAMRGACRGG